MKHTLGFMFLLAVSSGQSQSFVNSDLDGLLIGSSALPENWESVPYNDPNCIAGGILQATPDLTAIYGPVPESGINGYAYSGETFVSALIHKTELYVFHEGIMQTVSGFTSGSIYTIGFYQAVVKQDNGVDRSGSWKIVIDNDSIGVSSVSVSDSLFNSPYLVWKKQALYFVAKNDTHTIKFLPFDDDDDINSSYTNSNGGLRMGIDSIYLIPGCESVVDIGKNDTICKGEQIILDATNFNSTYLWQDGSKDNQFVATTSGIYWVDVSNLCGTTRDSIEFFYTEKKAPEFFLPQEETICMGSNITFNTGLSHYQFLWQDYSEKSSLYVNTAGIYWVKVYDNLCEAKDSVVVFELDCNFTVFVPNIFTPNNDGFNDYFTIRGVYLDEASIVVWNRWGEIMFETNRSGEVWDGRTFAGKEAPEGTYFYHVVAKGLDGKEYDESGTVFLNR